MPSALTGATDVRRWADRCPALRLLRRDEREPCADDGADTDQEAEVPGVAPER